jgi:hypothetical protein
MKRKGKGYLSSGLWLFLYYMVENGIEKKFPTSKNQTPK